MSEPEPLLKEELFRGLPPLWSDATLRQEIHAHNIRTGRCIVALDDDPTGTQTVHDIWVLTRWEVSDLTAALSDGETALYILTNSRSMPLPDAQQMNREIAANLVQASRNAQRQITVVSRSDSTLRGHFPGEVDALEQALAQAQNAGFDGICIIPFFPEGGRFTIDNIHWVQEGERLIPAAQTPYARDAVFGYQHSRLPEWVEEKTGGRRESRRGAHHHARHPAPGWSRPGSRSAQGSERQRHRRCQCRSRPRPGGFRRWLAEGGSRRQALPLPHRGIIRQSGFRIGR